MKKTVLLLTALICVTAAWGQDASAEVKKHINKIKKSQSYLSAEATLPNEEDALKTANELLVAEINEWVKTKRNSDKVQQIVLQDISSCSDKMNMKRGANVRALIKGEGQIILSDNEKGNDLQALSDISEPMKIEKEKPVSKKDKDKIESAVIEKIGADSKETSLNAVMGAKNMTDMKAVFADLKAKDAIQYGTYPSDEVSGDYYLLFYTRAGDVRTVVSVKNGILSDLHTQQEVNLSDFSGCGAYWFNLK